MIVAMSLLALLENGPTYGLDLKREFERRTSGMCRINVGQIYTTLQRLARGGLVQSLSETDAHRQRRYVITEQGGACLRSWFDEATLPASQSRNELVMKVEFASTRSDQDLHRVVQTERHATVQRLQTYVRRKEKLRHGVDPAGIHLLDWSILQAEAQLQWLAELEPTTPTPTTATQPTAGTRSNTN